MNGLVLALCEALAKGVWSAIPADDKAKIVRSVEVAAWKTMTEHPAWPRQPTDPNPSHL